MKIGDKGDNVKDLQNKLNTIFGRESKYYLVVDGDFGQKTKDTVVMYQTLNGSLTLDGIVGEKTLQAINTHPAINPNPIGQNLSKRLECHLDSGFADIDSKKGLASKMRYYPIITLSNGINNMFHQIVDFLDVEKSERYQKVYDKNGKLKTYCNIYAYDYCSFTWAFLPRVYWKTKAFRAIKAGDMVKPIYGETVHEMNANSLYSWLINEGEKHHNWQRVTTEEEIQRLANQGHVCLICAKRWDLGSSGHITVVLPETTTRKMKNGIPLQSQAGATNSKYTNTGYYKKERYSHYGFFVNKSVSLFYPNPK